jgi:glycosyltransferase involved in cell wall biosynthesis
MARRAACDVHDNRRVLIGIDASRAFGDKLTLTGTERYSREIVAALLKIAPQHRFRLYLRGSPTPHSHGEWGVGSGESDQLELVYIHQRRLWTHIGLSRELIARPPDGLFVPAHVLPAVFAMRRERLRSRALSKVRTVVTIHDVGYRYFPQAHPLAQRLYLDWSTTFSARFASAVVVDSDATRRDVERFYRIPAHKLIVAYPGPLPLPQVTESDACKTMEKFGLHLGQPYALHVGTLQPRKNLRRLVQAWSIMRSRATSGYGGLKLILAGAKGWGDEDLQAEVNALDLQEDIRFTGYVCDVEKSALMRGARAIVFPSLYEGFGFPVLEAQSVGAPVACSNTSSLPEVAGHAALLFDPLSVEDIAGAVQRVLFDEAMRTMLIASGYRNVTRFSWERCAEVILNRLEVGNE